MSTYIALVQPTDEGTFNTNRAIQTIKNGNAVAERHGIQIKNFYWTSGPYNAVLVLQAADTHGLKGWRDRLKNLHVQLIPAVQDPESVTQMTPDQWGASCDMIHWWY